MDQKTMPDTSSTATADADTGNALAPSETAHPWLIVVLAQQRSGTTAFARTLGLGEKIQSYGEVFHNVRMSSKVNYFNFREEVIKAEPRMAFVSNEHQFALWHRYIGGLKQNAAKPFVMIDAKYNSWHHFNGVWYSTGDAPAMVTLVKKGRAKVIHIVRRNLFAQACSSVIAERRQQWHFTKMPDDQPTDVVINPRAILARMQRSRGQTELFRKFFAGYEHYCELSYEEIFAADHLTATTQDRVSDLMGEDCDGAAKVPLSKATPPLRQVIANSEEILDFLGSTKFGEMVAAELRR